MVQLLKVKRKKINIMKVVKYNPLNDFIPSTFGGMIESMLNNEVSVFTPSTDVVKTENEIVLHIVAPGMTKDSFELNLDDNLITISGERVFDESQNYTQVESRFGSFKRSFKLGDAINREKISAKYENGVLQVTLPMDKKKLERKSIKIA